MFVQNKKAIWLCKFSLIQAITWNYQNLVPKWRFILGEQPWNLSAFQVMFWNFLNSWKKSGNCLCNADSGISSSAAGSVLQEEHSLGKSSVWGVCYLPQLQLDHQAELCPSTCSCILSPLRVTFKSIRWSGWNIRNPSCKLSYPGMHPYLTYLEISRICKTLSAFLLIGVTEYCWP